MCLEIFGTHFEGDDVVILELIIWIRIAQSLNPSRITLALFRIADFHFYRRCF